jgi:hypothetical protein
LLATTGVSQQVLMDDFTLQGDVTHTGPGPRFIIAAPGITLDLNGYTVSGDGSLNSIGVENFGGFPGVTIKNGTFENFDIAAIFVAAPGAYLDEVDVVAAGWVWVGPGVAAGAWGVGFIGCDDLVIDDVDVSNALFGIGIDAGQNLQLKDIEASDCWVGVGAIHTGFPATATGSVTGSTFVDCDVAGVFLDKADGFAVEDCEVSGSIAGGGIRLGNTPAEVKNVQIRNCESFANLWGIHTLRIDFATGARLPVSELEIRDNDLHDCLNGFLFIQLENSTVAENDSWNNYDSGLVLGNRSNGNQIAENTLTGNGNWGMGLWHSPGAPTSAGPFGNTIEENTALGNGVFDLFHSAAAIGNTWIGNTYATSSGGEIQ